MVLGHFGVGLASKKFAPAVSLGTLILACQFMDFIWCFLVILGIEHYQVVPGITAVNAWDFCDIPFTHGLLGSLVLSVLFGTIYFLIKKDRQSSIVLGLVVFSHWILDLLSHRPDLPLICSSGLKVGLGLWYSFWGTLIVELGLFIAGLVIYISVTKARRKLAFLPLILFVLFSTHIFTVGLFSIPSSNPVTVGISSGIVFIIWFALAYWTDALRDTKNKSLSDE